MEKDSVELLEEVIDSIRNIEGFPIAKDEDIIKLSDPPYYTACPNPYINLFLESYGTPYEPKSDNYNKVPFVWDVKEGKHHPIYLAHTYHTKVPHQAVQKFINHYTKPGDIVYDGFCGTGMVAIAANLSNRYAIVSEISPFATFIAYNFLNSLTPEEFTILFEEMLKDVKKECEWMYKTKHTKKAINTRTKKYAEVINGLEGYGLINYVVWNDVYECPFCQNEICFGETLDNSRPGEFNEKYICQYCNSEINAKSSKRVRIKKYDSILGSEIEVVKEKPILISYSLGSRNFWKTPDEFDYKLIEEIDNLEIPYCIPNAKIPYGYNTKQALKYHNITHVHHYYTRRNLHVLSKFFDFCKEKNIKLWFIISSLLQKASKLMALNKDYIGRVTKGVLYISSTRQEINLFHYINKNIVSFMKALEELSFDNKSIISTQSTTDLRNIPSNSIDYIFTDPPFGGNIMYSELNFIWEAFLKVFTNIQMEAVENKVQGKTLQDYTSLMVKCFKEMYRVLKPNRWITIEFHNSNASVWNSIQEAVTRAGFIISLVSVLDKKIGSFKQITSARSVKNDLIINAYKPKVDFSSRFIKNAGEGLEIEFIKDLLEHLPIIPIITRTEKMLFSKMLAHYVENGYKIKYSSVNFYKLLPENFIELDGYWFLEEQVKTYNKWKSNLSLDKIKELLIGQQILFVSDEKTALIWLYNFLNTPKEYSEVFTDYQKILINPEDKIPELKELLDNNFILDGVKYRRPFSIKEKDDIKKFRIKELNGAFKKIYNKALSQKGKLQMVRKEALEYGLLKLCQEQNYEDIIRIANKLSKKLLMSSGEIMDFIDIAKLKTVGLKKNDEY